MLSIITVIFALLIVIVVHEMGHVIAMRKRGIYIKEFGIGIPIPYVPSISLSGKWLGNLKIVFHPLLIGAYVRFSERAGRKIKRLPPKDQIAICLGGVKANLHLFWLTFLTALIIANKLSSSLLISIGLEMLRALVIAYVVIYIWKFIPRVVTRFILLGLLSYLTFRDTHSTGGPIAIVKLGVSVVHNAASFFAYISVISVSLSLMNLMPFSFLDGGKVSEIRHKYGLDKKREESPFEKKCITAADLGFLLLMAFIFFRDILHLF